MSSFFIPSIIPLNPYICNKKSFENLTKLTLLPERWNHLIIRKLYYWPSSLSQLTCWNILYVRKSECTIRSRNLNHCQKYRRWLFFTKKEIEKTTTIFSIFYYLYGARFFTAHNPPNPYYCKRIPREKNLVKTLTFFV